MSNKNVEHKKYDRKNIKNPKKMYYMNDHKNICKLIFIVL